MLPSKVCCLRSHRRARVTDKDNTAINGVTAIVKDRDGNTIFSVATSGSGDIATQTVSRGYYDQAHGNTLQDYGPHTLTISKAARAGELNKWLKMLISLFLLI